MMKEMIVKRYTTTVIPLALLVLSALPVHAAEIKGKNPAAQVHKGQGTVKRIDEKASKVNIAHGPIPSLNWPAMTMDLQLSNKALLKGVALGQNVEFDIAQTGPTQFVITRIAPGTEPPARNAPAGADAHQGHH